MAYKILIADDEHDIRALLKDFFEMQGYQTEMAKNGREVLEKVSRQPDLILLDINMPGMDGLEVCRRVREHVSCPILFLTARVEEQDRVNGLMIGGDDYIVKPFSLDELGARVAAHLRREARAGKKDQLRFSDDLVIHYSSRCVYFGERNLGLTRTEFDIVELLSMNRGQVFSKERIYEKLWGYDSEGDENIVTEHIRRIRMKFKKYSDKTYIATVWGVGYQWAG
ncbi:response regulator transcription factor [Lacrimispora sp. NSJ-141]|uniref:Stage 0 sporulation protein A homolog n=1 Tax=Lientehia hominis TaxID=2897778 RepID=A0AAP2RK60_9FIRM|nr:response regulator transcription factor [Lientehia hominis]MCD2492888.1 response regulator transcription factor [Lientehia hominis]